MDKEHERREAKVPRGRDQSPRTVVSVTRELRNAVIGSQREAGPGPGARAQVPVEGAGRAWAVREKKGEV